MRWTPESPFDTPLLDAPLLRSRLGCVALTLLLGFGIMLRVRNLDIPTGRSPDEANYTAQAQRLLREGGAGLRGIAREYIADPAARLAGPPTRAGYLWALAATMKITGRGDETAGALLSCAASIGSLLLLTLIGIRFFPPWASVYALLFFAIFPPELELARRAWADALVGLLGLAVVYTAMETTRETLHGTGRRFWHAAFILTGCLGTVVKEFGAVTFALCAAWVVGLLLWRGQRREARIVTVAGLIGAALCLLWLAHGVGGLGALTQVVRDWRGAHVSNQYAIDFQSGPPTNLLRAFWVLSPALVVGLALALCGGLTARLGTLKRHLPNFPPGPDISVRALAFFATLYLTIPMLLPNWHNLRYVSVLFAPLMLLSGWGVAAALAALGAPGRVPVGQWRRLLQCSVLAAVTVAFVSDYRRFPKFFVNDGVGDLR